MFRSTLMGSVLLTVILCSGIAVSGLAQEGLQVQEYQGVTYVSGGIGLDEREALQAMARQFNLKLGFAAKAGNYLSDVNVRILDARGNPVLEATSNGPLFYAKLAPGNYTVEVGGFGQRFRRAARVGRTGQTQLNFYWDGQRGAAEEHHGTAGQSRLDGGRSDGELAGPLPSSLCPCSVRP